MLIWFGNIKTMWKLMLGFAMVGLIMAVMGGIAGQGVTSIREKLRVVYEDYTVAGTDLALVAGNLNRTRTNDFLALNAQSKEEFEKVINRDAEITESVKKPLEAYAATVLRISKSGRDEAKDLQKFRDAYAAYVAASDMLYATLTQAWATQSKSEMEALRAKAFTISLQNAGPKMEATIVALDELIATVKDVAKDMNDEGSATVSNTLVTLAVGTTAGIVIGLLLGWLIGRVLSRNLADVIMVAQALGSGDLTARSSVTSNDEVGQLGQAFNSMGEQLHQTVTVVRETVDGVSAGAEQITKANEDLSQRTSEQASALEETSASMEEMISTVKQNADNAKQANQLAIAARNVADEGGLVTTRAVDAMGEINKSSKKIADIITVIDEIAFQTNLLALNAAVEAARAGEHGRGFAVVAAEVRNLAQRSATAAKEIKGLINESIQRVTDGSELVNQSGKTLGEIVTSVKRVTDIIAEITAASQEQASGIDQVNKAIMQMDETTQQNAALVEETTSASQSMKDQAKELMRQVAVFKVNGTSEASHVKREASESGTKYASRTTLHAKPTPKPMVKRPLAGGKPAEAKEPVGVAAGNGKDRRHQEAEFEEF